MASPFGWAAPARANAQEGAAEADILNLIKLYRRTIESKEIDGLAQLYDDFSADQRVAQKHHFQNVSNLRVTTDDVEIAVVGEEAVVSYTRTDDFVDVRTGRPMHVAIRLTKMLRRAGDGWKLVAAQ